MDGDQATDNDRREAARATAQALEAMRAAADVELVAALAIVLVELEAHQSDRERWGLADAIELAAGELPRAAQRRIGWGRWAFYEPAAGPRTRAPRTPTHNFSVDTRNPPRVLNGARERRSPGSLGRSVGLATDRIRYTTGTPEDPDGDETEGG